jgi:hypothetical protein
MDGGGRREGGREGEKEGERERARRCAVLGMMALRTPLGTSLWAEHGLDDLLRLAMLVCATPTHACAPMHSRAHTSAQALAHTCT